MEGLAGSAFSDILLGSNADATEIDIPGTLSGALTDPSRAREMATAGRALVEQEFNLHTNVAELRDYFMKASDNA